MGDFVGTRVPISAVGSLWGTAGSAQPAPPPRAGRRTRAGRTQPAPVASGARNQLADAQRCLARAMAATDVADRYAAAHLGALRGAAAILATRPHPLSRTLKNASAWVQLDKEAPEYSGWAAYFAAGSAKRKAAEAGIARLITADEADQLVRRTADFLDLVESSLLAAA